MNKRLCFLTVATGKWDIFILPYIFSCLYFNRDSYVEVLTRNYNRDEKALQVLNEMFGQTFEIYEVPVIDKKRTMPDCAIRFVIEPKMRLEYTYIGDIDILILESDIVKFHEEIISTNGGYYSNIVRPSKNRFTGLHCVKTEKYFEKTRSIRESILCEGGSDEKMLFNIVDRSIGNPLDFPNKKITQHGFHLSLMREPKKDINKPDKPTWSLGKEHQQVYLELKKSKEWQLIYPYFDEKYKDILRVAEENF